MTVDTLVRGPAPLAATVTTTTGARPRVALAVTVVLVLALLALDQAAWAALAGVAGVAVWVRLLAPQVALTGGVRPITVSESTGWLAHFDLAHEEQEAAIAKARAEAAVRRGR